jgi:hypothetical protein
MCGNCEYERKNFFKMELNAIEIKKDLYKSKTVATLHRYESGNLWYRIQTSFGNFEFPIAVVETKDTEQEVEVLHRGTNTTEVQKVKTTLNQTKLSPEIGLTPFYSEIKASELNRWIERSIKDQTILPYYM